MCLISSISVVQKRNPGGQIPFHACPTFNIAKRGQLQSSSFRPTQWGYTEIYCNIFSCAHSYFGVHGLESWDCQNYYQNNFPMGVVACDYNS